MLDPSRAHDVLILGSGAAGLSTALHLADHTRVVVVSKGSLTEGCTLYAQGGVAAVLDPTDSIDSHVADTLNAGAGLCHEDVVRFSAERAPEAIRWLIGEGVAFTREEQGDGYHLTREGGLSHRRVIHATD